MGRWISRDPSEEDGGSNLYAFVSNNSVDGFDLLGLILDKNTQRRKWLHYKIALNYVEGPLADKLLVHYIWGLGRKLDLKKEDVKDLLKPKASLLSNKKFRNELFEKMAKTDCCPYKRIVRLLVFDESNPSGGLGYYHIVAEVKVKACNGQFEAVGTASIYDRWDFNYKWKDVKNEIKSFGKNGHRNIRTYLGSHIDGDPFRVFSVDIPIKQTSDKFFNIEWIYDGSVPALKDASCGPK